jgi:Nup53/35/40-type RNA recognition motif
MNSSEEDLRKDEQKREEPLSKYPGLFDPGLVIHRPNPRNTTVPDSSLYDEQHPPQEQKKESALYQKTVTVFGYSVRNLDRVRDRFRECGEVKEICYGKNWMDIRYEDERSMFKALSDSGTIIGGEMIGVVQRHKRERYFGGVWRESVFLKKKEGVFRKIFSYLFGE